MLLTVQGMAIYHKSQFLAHFGPAWSILIQKIINYAWAQVQIHLLITICFKAAWKYASNSIWHDYIPQKSIFGPFRPKIHQLCMGLRPGALTYFKIFEISLKIRFQRYMTWLHTAKVNFGPLWSILVHSGPKTHQLSMAWASSCLVRFPIS